MSLRRFGDNAESSSSNFLWFILHPIWQEVYANSVPFFCPLPLQYCLRDSVPLPEQLYAYECMYVCFLSFQLEKGFIIASASTVNWQEEGRQVSQPSDSCKISFPADSCYRVASQTSILDHDDDETRMFSLFHSFNTITGKL